MTTISPLSLRIDAEHRAARRRRIARAVVDTILIFLAVGWVIAWVAMMRILGAA